MKKKNNENTEAKVLGKKLLFFQVFPFQAFLLSYPSFKSDGSMTQKVTHYK